MKAVLRVSAGALLAVSLVGCCYRAGYYDPSTGLMHPGGVYPCVYSGFDLLRLEADQWTAPGWCKRCNKNRKCSSCGKWRHPALPHAGHPHPCDDCLPVCESFPCEMPVCGTSICDDVSFGCSDCVVGEYVVPEYDAPFGGSPVPAAPHGPGCASCGAGGAGGNPVMLSPMDPHQPGHPPTPVPKAKIEPQPADPVPMLKERERLPVTPPSDGFLPPKQTSNFQYETPFASQQGNGEVHDARRLQWVPKRL